MRATLLTLTVVFLILLIPFAVYSENPEEEYQLEQLLFPEDKLPPATKIAEIHDTEEVPFEIASNPYISEERDFITQYSKELFGESVNSENIAEALYVVYEEKDEIGICAFRFTNPTLAKEAEGKLPKGEKFFPIQKERILVFIWHDGVSDSVFEIFQDFIKIALFNKD